MTLEARSRREVVDALLTSLGGPDRASIVLRGPAGIGKSHLAHTTAGELEDRGVPVRRVVGGEAQRHLAFGALLHLLPLDAGPVTVEFELVQRLRAALIEQGDTAVVVVDDIGLLDERSAGLVESVLLRGDIAVLATERSPLSGIPDDHALTPALRARADVVEVPPMTDRETAALLVELVGEGELGSVRLLGEMSQGNPLIARELLDAARASNAIGERDGLWFLDDFRPSGRSLDRLVTDRLDRLADRERELLCCLAVAGTLPRRVAARIDVESLEHLERDGLVTGDPSSIGHPLYAEVIVGSLSPEQARRVCSKLVASVGPDDDVDPARLGDWLLRADHGIDDGVARRGSALAIARWENDLARRLLEAIAEPTVGDRTRLIWAHANVGHLDLAAAAADRAVEHATTDAERVEAGLARAELWALQMNRRDEAFGALEELRSGLDDPALVARVDGATTLYSHMTGDGARAGSTVATSTAAAPTGRTADDGETRLAVVMGQAYTLVFSGRFDAAGPIIAEGLALSEQLGERHNWVRLRIAEALRTMLVGDLEAADAIVGEHLRLADVEGVRPAHVVWLGLATQLAEIRGDFQLAELRAREAVRSGDRVDDFGAAGFVRGDLSALMIELGRGGDLDHRSSPIGLARARVRAASPSQADDLAAELAVVTAGAGYLLWAPWVAREAVRRGPAPRCAALLVDWASRVDGPVFAAFADHAAGVVARDAARVGHAADVLQQLDVVVPALDAHVAALELALDAGAAGTQLRRSLVRLAGLADRVTPALPPAMAERFTRIATDADMPSDRQMEIAGLAASGLTSKEIAARLIVSARTVDNHLAAVYRKLGVSGRDELAAVLSG